MPFIICFIAISAIMAWGPFFIMSCAKRSTLATRMPAPIHTHQGIVDDRLAAALPPPEPAGGA